MLEPFSDLETAPFLGGENPGSLAVILCHFNPCLYRNPVANLRRVLRWLGGAGVAAYAVELRCGKSLSCAPVLPTNSKRVLQLSSEDVFFRKENLWNIAAALVPRRIEKFLFLDADVLLEDRRWFAQIEAALDEYNLVQPFSRAVWLDSRGAPYREKFSSAFAWRSGWPDAASGKAYHAGFSVALRRDCWQSAGGHFNGVLGEGASAMMAAAMGQAEMMSPYFQSISKDLAREYHRWAESFRRSISGKIGFLDASLNHLWHGHTAGRKYIWYRNADDPAVSERMTWLRGFEPSIHLQAREPYGLIEWSDRARSTRQDMISSVEAYFGGRNEDEWFESQST